MRRVLLLLVVAAAMLALAAGAVMALSKTCGGGDCVGSREADMITGSTSADQIAALEGNDTITQPQDFLDQDTIYGDEGNDTIDVRDNVSGAFFGNDTVSCGPGKRDKVFFNKGDDTVSNNCEIKKPL